MVIKKIFAGVFDDEVHNSFLKFGRGEYRNKFLLEGKKQSNKWSIKSGPEFVNFLVRKCLGSSPEKILVKGIIVSTNDLRDEIPFSLDKVSNFQGVRKHVVNTEVKTSDLKSLVDSHPRTFFGLSFSGDDFVLKIKAKAPTSGKPGKESNEGPKADFCSLKTSDSDLISELFFDNPNFKDIVVSHIIKIDNIIYPEAMDSLSPKEVRELAKREGIIFRKSVVDGKESVSEAKFVA